MQEFIVFLYNIGTNTGNAQNTAWSAFWIDCWLIIIDRNPLYTAVLWKVLSHPSK